MPHKRIANAIYSDKHGETNKTKVRGKLKINLTYVLAVKLKRTVREGFLLFLFIISLYSKQNGPVSKRQTSVMKGIHSVEFS